MLRTDDLQAGRALLFADAARPPGRVVAAHGLDEVVPSLVEVQAAVAAGSWAVGFVAYEAGPALDGALVARTPDPRLPLVWFALVDAPTEVPVVAPGLAGRLPATSSGSSSGWSAGWSAGPWEPDTTARDHAAAVAGVRERIARGETYQVNLTLRMSAPFEGDPTALYADLVRAQRGDHGALLDLRPHGVDAVVASASPEAFFSVVVDPAAPGHQRVVTRPMKGTAPRGRSAAEDALALHRLAASAKERAENVMIVDLLRNDLHRVCEPGSVEVTELLAAQTYPTVHQVVSTVEGRLRPGTSTVDLFRALFPCGSVTGAPKASTMRAVAKLERSPRGVYCGAVGWLAPPGEPVTARFSVAIRTAVVTGSSRGAAGGPGALVTYGSGSGVTWDSRAGAEHREVVAKAAVLGRREQPHGLLETLAYRPGLGLVHVERHLRRLASSAAFCGIPLDSAAAHAQLDDAVARALGSAPAGDGGAATASLRVRLELCPDGALFATAVPLPPSPSSSPPVRLALDAVPRVRSDDWWPRHKTTRRGWIDALRAEHRVGVVDDDGAGPDEVVWTNERGEVCEASTANLAAHLDGRWWTPPVECGLLPGVLRERLLESGQLELRVLYPDDLRRAERLALLSSLRGWRPAVLA